VKRRPPCCCPLAPQTRRSAAEARKHAGGIELALFEVNAGDNFPDQIPKDTAASKVVDRGARGRVAQGGADIILGPLFGANVKAIQIRAARARPQVPNHRLFE